MSYVKEVYKAYYERNKEKILARNKVYMDKRKTARAALKLLDPSVALSHPNQNRYTKNWRDNNPWVKFLYPVRQSCNNKKHKYYPAIGGQGIRCVLSVRDVKDLWFKYKAYQMKRPRLVRIDDDLNFTADNCKFATYTPSRIKGFTETNVITKNVELTQEHYDEYNNRHPEQKLIPPWVETL